MCLQLICVCLSHGFHLPYTLAIWGPPWLQLGPQHSVMTQETPGSVAPVSSSPTGDGFLCGQTTKSVSILMTQSGQSGFPLGIGPVSSHHDARCCGISEIHVFWNRMLQILHINKQVRHGNFYILILYCSMKPLFSTMSENVLIHLSV